MNPALPSPSDHRRNCERFASFHALQQECAWHLASAPQAVRAWLERLPPLGRGTEPPSAPRAGTVARTARLGSERRRELLRLLTLAEASPAGCEALAAWLLRCLPVSHLLAIGNGLAGDCLVRLAHVREELFAANYGLAKRAVIGWDGGDFEDRLSAASLGLLAAVDRYVPGAGSSRFGYFAGYWIRHHISRYRQKCRTAVAFPVYQHRLTRRLERLVAERQAAGLPPPTEGEACAALGIGAEAYRRQALPPRMESLDSDQPGGEPASGRDRFSDPAHAPDAALEESEAAASLEEFYRARTESSTRLMLAYARGVGDLAEAAADYLDDLRCTMLRALRS